MWSVDLGEELPHIPLHAGVRAGIEGTELLGLPGTKTEEPEHRAKYRLRLLEQVLAANDVELVSRKVREPTVELIGVDPPGNVGWGALHLFHRHACRLPPAQVRKNLVSERVGF